MGPIDRELLHWDLTCLAVKWAGGSINRAMVTAEVLTDRTAMAIDSLKAENGQISPKAVKTQNVVVGSHGDHY